MLISLVVAASDNDVISKDGNVPWFVRGELKLFKEITDGKPIIMGRKTYEVPKLYKSRPRLLPGRCNIIITRNFKYKVDKGGVIAHSLKEALSLKEVQQADEVCIIGGEQLFRESLPLADKIYLTRVHTTIPGGDKFFKFDSTEWKLIDKQYYQKDELSDRPYDFEHQVWQRK